MVTQITSENSDKNIRNYYIFYSNNWYFIFLGATPYLSVNYKEENIG